MVEKKFESKNRFVIDLGMNNGDDTDFYLKKGYKVLAVEANPKLCSLAKERFSKEIDENRLQILNAAILDRCGTVEFIVNLSNDHWSSFDRKWAEKEGTKCEEIVVDCYPVDYLFSKYGVPLYLKIDIEGADQMVLDQLAAQDLLPMYISVEDCRFGHKYLESLSALGYVGYKLLDQSSVPYITDKETMHQFKHGSSGPFGEDVPGSWLDFHQIKAQYCKEVRDIDGIRKAPMSHWWDIHCCGIGR